MINYLREQTGKLHEEVEQAGLMSPVFSGQLTKGEYCKILSVFYGYFLPLENKISSFDLEAIVPDIKSRRSAETIKDDLTALSCPEPELCTELPELSSLYQALGALYVLEGSTLGGQVILKELKKYSFLAEGKGTAFFYGYGPETGRKWRSFTGCISAVPENEKIKQEVARGACDTFRYLLNWINKNDQE